MRNNTPVEIKWLSREYFALCVLEHLYCKYGYFTNCLWNRLLLFVTRKILRNKDPKEFAIEQLNKYYDWEDNDLRPEEMFLTR